MSERKYDTNKLNDYLLGSTPDNEVDGFDELSLTDEAFVENLKIAEYSLIDDYINDELSGSNLKRFETHYLSSAIRREKVAFARSLKTYTEENQNSTEIAVESPARSWFGFSFLRLGLGLATLLIIFLGIVLFIQSRSGAAGNELIAKKEVQDVDTIRALPPTTEPIEIPNLGTNDNFNVPLNVNKTAVEPRPKESNSKSKGGNEPSVGGSVFSFILAPPLRGSGSLTSINVPGSATNVSASLRLESEDVGPYVVSLTDESGGSTLWTSGQLRATGSGKLLKVLFSARLLKSGIYNFTVSGTDVKGNSEIVATYPIKIVIKNK